MLRNLFKSEADKTRDELTTFRISLLPFIKQYQLEDRWQEACEVAFRGDDAITWIEKNSQLTRSSLFFQRAKEEMVAGAFAAYLLTHALPPLYSLHLNTLKRKERTLTVTDDYGVEHYEKWFSELEYFFEHVIKYDLNHWIEQHQQQLNQLWPDNNPAESVWGSGRVSYRAFTLPRQFERLVRREILRVVDEMPEPHTPGYNPHLSGIDYEHFVASCFEKAGAACQVTRGSGDHGLDILVDYRGCRLAVQCKHYQGKVGNKAIQEVFAAKQFYDCLLAMVVSNSEFTPHARQAAQKLDVYLYHHDEIAAFIQILDEWIDAPDGPEVS